MIEQFERCQRRWKAELLRQISQVLTSAIRMCERIDAAQRNGAGVGLLQRCEHPQQCGLTGTVWSEQPEHFTACDVDRHAVQCHDTARIRHRDVAGGEHGVSHDAQSSLSSRLVPITKWSNPAVILTTSDPINAGTKPST